MSGTPERRTPAWRKAARAGILMGVALVVAGVVVRDVRASAFVEADRVGQFLWVAGAVLLTVGVVADRRSVLAFVARRTMAEQANFVVVVVLSVALAGLACYISTRRFARMDWTGKGKHRLHSQTESILRALDRDVEATVIHDPLRPADAAVHEYVLDVLEEFRSRTSRIHVKAIDLTSATSPGQIRALGEKIGARDIVAPSVVFATDKSHQVVSFGSIASFESMAPVYEFSGEAAFAGALVRLTEEDRPILYALTGHGEKGLREVGGPAGAAGTAGSASAEGMSLSRFVEELERDLYEVKQLDLLVSGEVPEDCAALIIAGPKTPFAETELAALRQYLDRQEGSALFMVDSSLDPEVATNVATLLGDYGVEVRPDAVGVTPQLMLTQEGLVGVAEAAVAIDPLSLPRHPTTRDIEAYRVVLLRPCPVRVGAGAGKPGLDARALLTGTPSSWGEADLDSLRAGTMEYSAAEDLGRPVVVGAFVERRPQPYGPPDVEDRGPKIVVLGNSESFTDYHLEQYPGNLYLALNCMNWMAGRAHMLGIPPKTVDLYTVPVSAGQVRAARYLFIGAVPACAVLLGVAVWLLRRR
jgi:hypothetical protein